MILITRAKARAMALLSLALCGVASAAGGTEPAADLILHNTKVWTADEDRPLAEAVAIRDGRILRVGTNQQVLALRGPSSRVLDLRDRLVVPGFIDGHTHFENATEWFFEARLMDIDTEAGMLERLGEATQRVPGGLWITGGDWGELKARQAVKRGERFLAFTPSLAAIDAISPDHPVLFRRHNGDYFANSRALETLRIVKNRPDPDGGSYQRDPRSGDLTGMLLGRAGDRAAQALPPKSMARTLIAARALVRELNSYGITGIHDIARLDEVSQQQIHHAHVERSYSDLGIFTALRDEHALTVRVYAMLQLSGWDRLAEYGIAPGGGDDLIRYGALKSFIDGSLMFEPHTDNPAYSGDFTFRVSSPEALRADFLGADRHGFDMATHQIGDKAISMYLDWMEQAVGENGARERRLRLIHMEYPRLRDIRRAGKLRAFADMTPVHMLAILGKIEERVGPDRARTAFAGRTLIDNGVRINLVSDWPGDFYKFHSKPLNPLVNIFHAVTRRGIGQAHEQAWHPEEALTVEEGLRAYTINPADAAHEASIKGSISEGKFADLVVLSKDILPGPPEELLSTEVLYTIFNGDIVYEGGRE